MASAGQAGCLVYFLMWSLESLRRSHVLHPADDTTESSFLPCPSSPRVDVCSHVETLEYWLGTQILSQAVATWNCHCAIWDKWLSCLESQLPLSTVPSRLWLRQRLLLIPSDFKALALLLYISVLKVTQVSGRILNQANKYIQLREIQLILKNSMCVSFPNVGILLLRRKHESKGMEFWFLSKDVRPTAFIHCLSILIINLCIVNGRSRTCAVSCIWEVSRVCLSIDSHWKEVNHNLISSSSDWARSAVLQICLVKEQLSWPAFLQLSKYRSAPKPLSPTSSANPALRPRRPFSPFETSKVLCICATHLGTCFYYLVWSFGSFSTHVCFLGLGTIAEIICGSGRVWHYKERVTEEWLYTQSFKVSVLYEIRCRHKGTGKLENKWE